MTSPSTRRLYRVVRSNPPALDDFSSKAQLGIPCPIPDPEVQHRWSGLSLFGTEDEARRVIRRLPMLGTYIAALDIPEAAGVNVERTYGRSDATGDGLPQATASGFEYEVWELASHSLIMAYDAEDEALDLVRQLIAAGWSTDDLVLGAENAGLDVADLPPVIIGAAL